MRRVPEVNYGLSAPQHNELDSLIGQGTSHTLGELSQKWIGDPRTPDIFALLTELGPDNVEQMLKRLTETRSLIYTATRLKATLLFLGNPGKISIPSEACGYFLPHSASHGLSMYLHAFRRLGIFCPGEFWGNESNPLYDDKERIHLFDIPEKDHMPIVGPKKPLAFITATEKHTAKYNLTKVSLMETMDYLLDLCLMARIKGWQRTQHQDNNFLPCAKESVTSGYQGWPDIYDIERFDVNHTTYLEDGYDGTPLKFVLCLRTGNYFPANCHCFYMNVVPEDTPAGVIAYAR